MLFKSIIGMLRDYYYISRKRKPIIAGNITYNNWWVDKKTNNWFTTFIDEYIGKVDCSFCFFSVFGPANELRKRRRGIKIFYSGENLEYRQKHERLVENKYKVLPLDWRIYSYKRVLNKSNMDLALDFCGDNKNNSIRFPYWIISHFSHCYNLKDVQERLDELETNYHIVDYKRKDAAVISSHDFYGTRADICNALEGVINICYAGKWRNNTEVLKNDFLNNKLKYLSLFRLNICPENVDAKAYVTEKVWDSIEAGCIPIYGGALGNPEPNIFNKNAFILWDFDGGNEQNIAEVMRINNDDDYYQQKKGEKIFIEGADQYIFSLLNYFRLRMDQLIKAYS